jgi:DNA primase
VSRLVPRTGGVYEFLRANIDITEVLGGKVGEKVDCVFHDEDDVPDMHIYEDHAHCFACGGHGDVTKVWKAKHGFSSMWDAAQDLARKFKLDLPELSPEAKERYEKRRAAEDSAAEQAQRDHALLYKDVGVRAREYLESRGFDEGFQKRFLLGVTKDGKRAVMPFWSAGVVHGRISRSLDGSEPKYRMPAKGDFPLGRKPLLLREQPKAVEYALVEGVLDMPALEALGIPAIGAVGATFSNEQITDLRAMGGKGAEFVVIPDKDDPGSGGATRTARKLYPYARLADPIPVDGCKDAADLLKNKVEGAEGIVRGLMRDAPDLLENALSELDNLTSPRARVKHLRGTCGERSYRSSCKSKTR